MTSVAAPTVLRANTFAKESLREVIGVASITGLTMIYVSAIGMVAVFNERFIIDPVLTMGYLVLFSIPVFAGHRFTRQEALEGLEVAPLSGADVAKAVVAGALAGFFLASFALIVETFPQLRDTFPNLSPKMVELITLGYGTGAAFVVLPVASGLLAAIGASVAWLPRKLYKASLVGISTVLITSVFDAVIDDFFDWLPAIPDFLYAPISGLTVVSAIVVFVLSATLSFVLSGRDTSIRERLTTSASVSGKRNQMILIGLIGIAIIVLPQFLGGILNELFTNVGFFLIMALGLNVVVGYAGLLDLGYVAFFAVGAYTMAILTSPLSPFFSPEWSWWLAFPFVLIVATIAGLLVGTPVLRMRGDYLAIVTLGFGEIVRITLLSDWLAPLFGGAQGIRQIPGIQVAGTEVSAITPDLMVYAMMAFVFIAAYISWRIEDSRVGRAWAAMREDEDVAEAVGVDTVKAKLLAFITGAVIASFAGALFAAKVGSVFASSFQIVTSIIILVIVIVGGMGNIAGVAVGALILVGILGGPNQPGLLQEFGQFKLLLYGALLVYMMLKRPEGILPSKRRQQELHQEEVLQDAWLDKQAQTAELEGED
jgi:branched-chain amino acid transport system permease protein